MTHQNFSLAAFIREQISETGDIAPGQLEKLFDALVLSEHPRSIRVLIWILLRTFQGDPSLHASILEQWMPGEADLAQLLEDVGQEGTRTVLSLEASHGHLQRLWQLCDDAGLTNLVHKSSEPWTLASLAPMAALYAERQLDDLVAAVTRGQDWTDPSEILGDEGEHDLDALINLAQARLVHENGSSEPLNVTLLRLLALGDRVH